MVALTLFDEGRPSVRLVGSYFRLTPPIARAVA